MRPIDAKINRCLIASWLGVFFLSLIFFTINYLAFHYHGNDYFPSVTFSIGLSLILIWAGLKLQFQRVTVLEHIVKETLIYFLVMSVIAFFTNAIQLTPFKPIDHAILRFESYFSINLVKIIAWTAHHDYFYTILDFTYKTIAVQMGYIPLLIIIGGQYIYAREFFCLLLISALIGFTFYYFFPTMAPASVLHSAYFTTEQHNTGIKFSEIHHYLLPKSSDGGLIALPSFHAIWAWYCVYLVRCWPWAFALLLAFNGLLILSCVLLGWHYVSDLLGSLLIILLTQYIYYYATRKKLTINPFGDPARMR